MDNVLNKMPDILYAHQHSADDGTQSIGCSPISYQGGNTSYIKKATLVEVVKEISKDAWSKDISFRMGSTYATDAMLKALREL